MRPLLIFILTAVIATSCSVYTSKKKFKLAVSETDYSYNYSAGHLKSFLEEGGFEIEIVLAENAIEANKMVARGEADLTFVMNHSNIMPKLIGKDISNLRTIVPLFPRLLYIFSKEPVDTTNAKAIFRNKSIGVEVLNGETYSNLKELLNTGQITDIEIVSRDDNPNFIHFWGTSYGARATQLLSDGWTEISLGREWLNFFTLNDPALALHSLPAIPGVLNSTNLQTLSSETLLVTNGNLSELTVSRLGEYIVQHKLDLMRFDKMYKYIDQSFLARQLLYPLHMGMDNYLRRDEPSFFERYAELIALLFSVIAILYGAFQGIRSKLVSIKKERIDLYFLEYSDIRARIEVNSIEKVNLLDGLLQRALIQMTDEKLDKGDFDIFSRLVQQEIAILGNGK